MDSHEELAVYWQAYLDSLPVGGPRPTIYQSWHFTNTEEGANSLAGLVQAGIKTATSSLLWEYEAGGEAVPQPGDVSIITNWNGEPVCIIETIEVTVQPFESVDARHAFDEGEGDRSLAYWRGVHWRVFEASCRALGREPSEDMPVVCERFRMAFQK